MEKFLKIAGNVLEERENTIFGMFVAKRIKYETLFGNEGVSIAWNPIFSGSRNFTPR
jgi:hypothetical protein